VRAIVVLALFLGTLHAASATFELKGQVEEVSTPVRVRLYGAETPYNAFTISNNHGSFKFRGLEPGTYVVIAFVRRHGEARRTVVVTPSLADEKRVVHVSIPLPPPTSAVDRAKRRSTVSVTQLAIPEAARQKHQNSQRDLNRHDIKAAIAHLNEALKLAPKYAEAWNSLGVVYYQTKDYTQAEQCFRKATEIAPEDWTPAVNLGGVLLNLQRPQEALEYNRYAVKARPNDALANSQLGMTYFRLGEMEKAEQYLATAERLDPSHFSHPQLLLAEIYARRGDKASTLRELNDFVSRFPDSEVAAELRKRLAQVNK